MTSRMPIGTNHGSLENLGGEHRRSHRLRNLARPSYRSPLCRIFLYCASNHSSNYFSHTPRLSMGHLGYVVGGLRIGHTSGDLSSCRIQTQVEPHRPLSPAWSFVGVYGDCLTGSRSARLQPNEVRPSYSRRLACHSNSGAEAREIHGRLVGTHRSVPSWDVWCFGTVYSQRGNPGETGWPGGA